MLIGTFTPQCGWNGKTVEYDEASGQYILQGQGPVTARQVLKYQHPPGDFEWASDEMRAHVEARARPELEALAQAQAKRDSEAKQAAAALAEREYEAKLASEAATTAEFVRFPGRRPEVHTTPAISVPVNHALARPLGATSVRLRGVWCYLLAGARPPLRTLTKPGWDVDFRADEVVILRNNEIADRIPYREVSRLQVIGLDTEAGRDSFVLGGGEPLFSTQANAEFALEQGKPGGLLFEANSVLYFFMTDQETGGELSQRLSPAFQTLCAVHGVGADVGETKDVETVIEGLERLAKLHDAGALSDEEFAAFKAKLME